MSRENLGSLTYYNNMCCIGASVCVRLESDQDVDRLAGFDCCDVSFSNSYLLAKTVAKYALYYIAKHAVFVFAPFIGLRKIKTNRKAFFVPTRIPNYVVSYCSHLLLGSETVANDCIYIYICACACARACVIDTIATRTRRN